MTEGLITASTSHRSSRDVGGAEQDEDVEVIRYAMRRPARLALGDRVVQPS